MKKRIVIGSVITVSIIIVVVFFTNKLNKPSTPSNPSRREDNGIVMEEDLSAVDGSTIIASTGNTIKEETPKLTESIVGGGANSPKSVDVQAVRRIVIPEAMLINDGDRGSFYSNEDFFEIAPVDVSTFSNEQLPERYDSRDVDGKSYATAAEDQGYSYLCWSFAAMGAIESDILKHNEDISASDIDLSEKHLAYYNVHKADEEVENGISNDYRELVNDEPDEDAWIFDYDTGYVAVGGVTDYCISLLTSWKGPVSEQDNDSFKGLYGQEFLFKDNGSTPSNAYNSEYHIQDVYEICASPENRDYVKQMIMEHGAATIGVNADNKFWNNHNKNLYSYFDEEQAPTADHEVLIIGWDDYYSASNFVKKPQGDGAWICKNSWGSKSGEKGCFYLSYYDETTWISNAAAYNAVSQEDNNWYDNNYQVAGFITNTVSALEDEKNYVVALSGSTNPYGVLYEAKGDENLAAIGLMALDSYQQYEVEIYVNPEMEDGKIVFSDQTKADFYKKISALSGGYHTFSLDSEIELAKGDRFFVLIKPVTKGRLVYEEAADYTSEANYDEWNNLTGNIHNHYEASGFSYYISDDGNAMIPQDDKDFFVKAYTKNR